MILLEFANKKFTTIPNSTKLQTTRLLFSLSDKSAVSLVYLLRQCMLIQFCALTHKNKCFLGLRHQTFFHCFKAFCSVVLQGSTLNVSMASFTGNILTQCTCFRQIPPQCETGLCLLLSQCLNLLFTFCQVVWFIESTRPTCLFKGKSQDEETDFALSEFINKSGYVHK